MDLFLRVSERDGEHGKFKSFALVFGRGADAYCVVITYDKTVICNVLDVSPARLSALSVGDHYIIRKEKR